MCEIKFKHRVKECGLSLRGVAYLFDTPYETVRNWKYGKTKVPDDVMDKLGQLNRMVYVIFDK